MTVVEQKIKATDEDMSGQVAAFKRAGVKAIALTTAPTQLASVAGIAAAQGLNVPIVGNNPTFDPALLKTPGGEALEANAYVVELDRALNARQARRAEGRGRLLQGVSEGGRRRPPCRSATRRASSCTRSSTRPARTRTSRREGLVKAAHQLSTSTPAA